MNSAQRVAMFAKARPSAAGTWAVLQPSRNPSAVPAAVEPQALKPFVSGYKAKGFHKIPGLGSR